MVLSDEDFWASFGDLFDMRSQSCLSYYAEERPAESILHEVGHALSLGMKLKPGECTTSYISNRISRMKKADQDEDEARTCAIELLMWGRLGGSRRRLTHPLLLMASGGLNYMSRKDFELRVKALLRRKSLDLLAKEGVKVIRRNYRTWKKLNAPVTV